MMIYTAYVLVFLMSVFVFPICAKMIPIRLQTIFHNDAKDELGLEGSRETVPSWLSRSYDCQDFFRGMLILLCVVPFLKGLSDPLSIFAFTLLTASLAMMSAIDCTYKFIPDELIVIALGAAYILALKQSPDLRVNIIGMLVGYGFPALIRLAYMKLRGKEGLGLGDCKMLAVIGVWVGIGDILNVVLIASVLSICFYPFLSKKSTETPFGPFLAFSAILIMNYRIHFA